MDNVVAFDEKKKSRRATKKENVKNMSDVKKVNPIVIADAETGEELYVIEFSRATVVQAERAGFKVGNIADFPASGSGDIFYYACMKNHRKMTRQETDELFCNLGGFENQELMERLIALYADAMRSLNNGGEKNAKYAVKF